MKVTRIEQPPAEPQAVARLDTLPNGTLFVRNDVPMMKTASVSGTIIRCVTPDGILIGLVNSESVRLVGHKPLEWWPIEVKT